MDLGSLELQIFVSLTVVLGGAFVALVCDYLKGNNEQLREHNIELRVRKEEQERRLLLDPAGFLGQWLPGQRQGVARTATAAEPAAVARAVAPHEVMQSFADPDALAEAEERAARMHARVIDEPFESVDVPPLTSRRSTRNRNNRKSARQARKEPENYADWVRPEVIAKVARRAQATASYTADIREDLETLPEDALPEPLNAPESWDIRQQLPVNARNRRDVVKSSVPPTEAAPAATPAQTAVPDAFVEPSAPQEAVAAVAEVPQDEPAEKKVTPEDAVVLQKEIERVAQLERRPVPAAPGTILRPLTFPSLKLEEELQRVAEIKPAAEPVSYTWNSALLDEVIAASGTREVVPQVEIAESVEAPPVVAPQPVATLKAVAEPVVVEEIAPEPELIVEAEKPEETVVATTDLPAGEISLDHHEYWEQPVISSDGGGFPDTVFPSSPDPVGFEELPVPVLELSMEPSPSEEPGLVVAAESEPVLISSEHEYVALLPEPATFAVEAVPIEVAAPVQTNLDATAPVAELPAFEVQSNIPELTIEIPRVPVEAATDASEPVHSAFADVFLPGELILPVSSSSTELEAPVEEPSAPYAETSPFVYLIESAPEAEEIHEVEHALPVVMETESVGHLSEETATEMSESEEAVSPPPFYFELESTPDPEPVVEPVPAEEPFTVAAVAEVIDCYSYSPRASHHAGMGITPSVDYLQSVPGVETMPLQLALLPEPALVPIETDLGTAEESAELPDLLPVFADLPEYGLPEQSDTTVEIAATIAEPPPLWASEQPMEPSRNQNQAPAEPIDISALRQPEPELVAPAPPAIPDLLLPTGMHDISTWTRLMTLPNPMTGILILITLQSNESKSTLPQAKGGHASENTTPAIEKFMASFVREGDFGSHIAENEWVFIYSNDVAGFNQRRVGMISEKLWDFQLRHLGLANVNFKWGAIDVQSEPLIIALGAARDRMNQTNRARKLPGADRVASRRVVNG